MSNRNEWTSAKRLYLDADGKVVGEHDPKRVALLVGAGGSILLDRATELGLVGAPVAVVAPVAEAVTHLDANPAHEKLPLVGAEDDASGTAGKNIFADGARLVMPPEAPAKAKAPAEDKAVQPGKDKAAK